MKKAIFSGVLLLAVGVLSGCAQKQAGDDGGTNQASDQAGQGSINDNGGTIFDNIKDAFSSGQKMKCTYIIQEDGDQFQSEALIDGEKYRSTSTFSGQTTHVLFDGKATYTWTAGAGQGMKMDAECLQQAQEANEDGGDAAGEVAVQEDPFDGAVEVKCEKVNSIDFSIPSDMEFSDQCEMIKKSQQQLQQLQDNLPAGFELPDGVNMPSAQ